MVAWYFHGSVLEIRSYCCRRVQGYVIYRLLGFVGQERHAESEFTQDKRGNTRGFTNNLVLLCCVARLSWVNSGPEEYNFCLGSYNRTALSSMVVCSLRSAPSDHLHIPSSAAFAKIVSLGSDDFNNCCSNVAHMDRPVFVGAAV